MKALLIGNNFEALFNPKLDLEKIKLDILHAVDHLENNKLEKFLKQFFEKNKMFGEKETLLMKNYEVIFKKLISPALISQSNLITVDEILNEISWNIKPFLLDYKVGLGPNVIEVFIKYLYLFYVENQWLKTTKKSLEKFLQNKDIQSYFSQFKTLITTSYSPILDLINSYLEFKLSENQLVNLYGKFSNDEEDHFDEIKVLWKGERVNKEKVFTSLKGDNLDHLEIVGLNFLGNVTLLNKLLGIMQVHLNTPSQINYLAKDEEDKKTFYQLIKNNQIEEKEELEEYQIFKQKEKNGDLTILKAEKFDSDYYGYVVSLEQDDHQQLTLTRKNATLIKNQFYYNLKRFYDNDGYTIDTQDFLLKTNNLYSLKRDLVISLQDFEQDFAGVYNHAVQAYFHFDKQKPVELKEPLLDKTPNKVDHELESVEVKEVVVAELPQPKQSFWTKLFAKKPKKPVKSK